jgi:hypothetical protein
LRKRREDVEERREDVEESYTNSTASYETSSISSIRKATALPVKRNKKRIKSHL